ncbi:sterol 26-hydroxylase, mitochondrial [Mobula hypostoma]|uniref:sterol 26-hydroxylase, mitochondrial n=1 Tax=Mobula hypostoma TaxID=723540 RepID=UPI002FC3BA26
MSWTHSLRSFSVRNRLLLGIRVICPSLRYKSGARSPVDLGAVTEPPVRDQKNVQDIPSYGLLSNTYWYFIKGFYEKTHELQIAHKKKFGPIWKSSIGDLSVIHVADSDMIEEILRQEGKYPIRAYMPHWREYREMRGHSYGPLCEYGQEWNNIRSMLNPKLLKPKEVANYSPAINEVVTDFMRKIRWLRQTQGGGQVVYDISDQLYNFAFEGIGVHRIFNCRKDSWMWGSGWHSGVVVGVLLLSAIGGQFPPQSEKGFRVSFCGFSGFLPHTKG